MAGIHNEVTFHFRDGVETVNFPVFSTTSDLVSNVGSSFEVEGVVGNNPHLHKALDEAYLHRMNTLTAGGAFEYNYRYFDVDVNVVQNENILKSFTYRNCEISEYGIYPLLLMIMSHIWHQTLDLLLSTLLNLDVVAYT